MSFYFIYKISDGPGGIIKSLQKVSKHNRFQSAKQAVKHLRQQQAADTGSYYKIIFADNPLQAEQLLQEKRRYLDEG